LTFHKTYSVWRSNVCWSRKKPSNCKKKKQPPRFPLFLFNMDVIEHYFNYFN
jgi:hypothetical protein